MAEPARHGNKPTGARVLTSVPPVRPRPAGGMSGRIFGGHIPRREHQRTHFGRSLDLDRIESAILAANQGRMREITDMGRETIGLDGHVSAVLNKRLNRVAALPFEVEAATGALVNEERASAYADIVREQLDAIPRFKQRLKDLAWAFFDGRAAHEIEWQFVGGPVPWRIVNLHWIHPRRLSFGPDRELRVIDTFREVGDFRADGFEMRAMPYKFVEFMPRLFCDYPEREGLNRRILYFSYFGRVGTRERLILMELHGKPWRIVTQTGDTINDEGFDDAFENAEALGATSTARMPKGFEMEVSNPPNDSGAIHASVIEHANSVESKLVLGSTGTTDAVSTGLGSSIGDAHLSEEDMVIASDGDTIAEAVEDHLTDAIIAVNFGEAELINAPRFFIDTEKFERIVELDRIQKATDLGMEIKVEEAYKRTGFSRPDKTDAVLKKVQREGSFGSPAPPPSTEMAFPIGEVPPPRELPIEPVEGLGLPGPDDPAPGTPTDEGDNDPSKVAPPPPAAAPAAAAPDEDAETLSLQEARALAEKMTELQVRRCEHGRTNRCPNCRIERTRDVQLGDDGEPVWTIAWRATDEPAKLKEDDGEEGDEVKLGDHLEDQKPKKRKPKK